MDATGRLVDMGFLPVRRKSKGGKYKPNLSIAFKANGKLMTFGIDTTRMGRGQDEDQYFMITHAHTDHYGKSAMLSPKVIASINGHRLELRHDQRHQGIRFKLGDTIDIEGVEVKTYPTHHSIGATAFSWVNDQGTRILVTGDIKDYKDLPKCDVLVTEATYGNPQDLGCIFEDDIDAFRAALGHDKVSFGAYSSGRHSGRSASSARWASIRPSRWTGARSCSRGICSAMMRATFVN